MGIGVGSGSGQTAAAPADGVIGSVAQSTDQYVGHTFFAC